MSIKPNIYLDYNATCPLLPKVKEAMLDVMDMPLNPSSIHSYGRKAKMIIDAARARITNLVGADDTYQVIFTSCGTEANNMALKGFENHRVITSVIEHPSVLSSVGEGLIPVDENGIIRLEVLEQLLSTSDKPALVSIQTANNETGVSQPVAEIAKLIHAHKGIFHTDAVQAFSKIEFNALNIDADLITVSGHKFGGPIGAAALVFKKNLPLAPLMIGGGQEHRFRPGTQNVVAIHGFGVAADIALNMLSRASEIESLRDYFEHSILKYFPETIFFGKYSKRLPNTSLVSMIGQMSETQVIYFDLNKVALSAGAACSSGKVDFPVALLAMGVDADLAKTALRVSIGYGTTKEEMDIFIKLWLDFADKKLCKIAA